MGLQDRLTGRGSRFSAANGADPSDTQAERNSVIGDKKLSNLHYNYSINGTPSLAGNPAPSGLDLNGVNPLAPNRDPQTTSINNSFSNGTYRNSAPAEGVGRI
jgi:hypothetical protein|tara:strand:- start:204 stop:512 length:309 start_codon:yes stop_codon:yes gene_type:complete